jgi:hypothetical protein
MAGRIAVPPISEGRNRGSIPFGAVQGLLETLEKPFIVAERSGSLLLVNSRARQFLETQGCTDVQAVNLFSDLLNADSRKVIAQIEKGEHEVKVQIGSGEKKLNAQIRWMPEPDWLVVEIENRAEKRTGADPATQLTVQELLQER